MEPADALASPWAVVAAAVFGALWGSFYNVCIARIPRGLSVVRPPSHCFACGTPVRALDNVPLLSYLWLRGRCRSCGARFSPRYLLVEGLTAAMAAVVYLRDVVMADPQTPTGVQLARFGVHFAFVGVMIVLSFIDIDTKRLPDVITLPSIPVMFLAGFATHEVAWLDRAIGAAAGYLVIRLIADGYYYLTGREGMGLGDGKLLAVIGALLGWRALPVIIFASAFLGILISVPVLLVSRRARGAAAGAGAAPAGGASGSSPAATTPMPHGKPPAGGASPASPAPGTTAPSPGSTAPTPGATATATPPSDSDGQTDEDAEEDSSVRHTEVPFGPFLALSGVVYLLFATEIQGLVERWIMGGAY